MNDFKASGNTVNQAGRDIINIYQKDDLFRLIISSHKDIKTLLDSVINHRQDLLQDKEKLENKWFVCLYVTLMLIVIFILAALNFSKMHFIFALIIVVVFLFLTTILAYKAVHFKKEMDIVNLKLNSTKEVINEVYKLLLYEQFSKKSGLNNKYLF